MTQYMHNASPLSLLPIKYWKALPPSRSRLQWVAHMAIFQWEAVFGNAFKIYIYVHAHVGGKKTLLGAGIQYKGPWQDCVICW